jgi:hypothetical protein
LYLTALLKVANKKLIWEKNMSSLQKRTREIMSRVSQMVNDPKSPLDDQEKASLVPSLNAVQAAMQRLAATSGISAHESLHKVYFSRSSQIAQDSPRF